MISPLTIYYANEEPDLEVQTYYVKSRGRYLIVDLQDIEALEGLGFSKIEVMEQITTYSKIAILAHGSGDIDALLDVIQEGCLEEVDIKYKMVEYYEDIHIFSLMGAKM